MEDNIIVGKGLKSMTNAAKRKYGKDYKKPRQAAPNPKAAANLRRRIADFENIKKNLKAGQELAYRRPGSMKIGA